MREDRRRIQTKNRNREKKLFRPLFITSNDHPLHYLQGITNNDRNAIINKFTIIKVGEEFKDIDGDMQKNYTLN